MKNKRAVLSALAVVTLLAAVCCAGTASAQQPSQAPKPGPDQQKLQLWFGEWIYEGESQTTFLGPGGKSTGRMTGRPIMDGFGAEYVFVENGPSGEIRTFEIDTYDPVAKNYPYFCVSSDGSFFQGSFTMNGNIATWEGTSVVNGRQFKDRGTDTVAPDGMSFTKKGEISIDGKAWLPWSALKATKVKAAPPENASVEPPRSSGVVMVRGTALPYLTEGSGIPCLVAGYSTLYEAVFSDELKKHFQFIFVDWKNSFLADDPLPLVGKITMETLVDDLDEVRRQLGHEKIAILGHSYPGFLPLAYGKKYPSHASHLISIGCPPYANKMTDKVSAEYWEQDASPERKTAHRRNLEALPDSLLDKLGPRERWVIQYVRDRAMCWANFDYDCYWLWLGKGASMDFEHQYYSVLTADYDPTPHFGEITPPVFLALGRYDYWTPPKLWDTVKDKIPNLSYNLFQKSGHWPMLEEQELFDRKLIDWLQGAKK